MVPGLVHQGRLGTLAWLALAVIPGAALGQGLAVERDKLPGGPAVVWSPKGDTYLAGGRFGEAAIVERKIEGGEEVRRLKGHEKWVTSLALVGDGKELVSTSEDGTVLIWRLKDGERLKTMKDHAAPVLCSAVSADGKLLVTGGQDGSARVFDLRSGKATLAFVGHETIAHDGSRPFVNAVACSPKGDLVLSAGDDHKVRAWDLKRGREQFAVGPMSRRASAVAFSPADPTVWIAGDMGGELRLGRGKEARIVQARGDPISAVAFTSDGRRAIVGTEEGGVYLLDVGTGAKTAEVRVQSWVGTLALSRDGRRILVGTFDGLALLRLGD